MLVPGSRRGQTSGRPLLQPLQGTGLAEDLVRSGRQVAEPGTIRIVWAMPG